MIDFNENDFNLTKLKTESKLGTLLTRFKYRIYGLRQENNPAILIEYHHTRMDNKFGEKVEALTAFLKANGIEVETYSESDNINRIDVGMRRDLRGFVNKNGKPLLASAILSTIIYCLEGRIELEQLKKFKLSAIPKLPIEEVAKPVAKKSATNTTVSAPATVAAAQPPAAA